MYLNHFCFVLVLVSVSASFFDHELPLYLSDDDILISQIPRISKRSISEQDKTKITIEKNEKGKEYEDGIEDGAESGLVFIPSFGRRSRRSILEDGQKIKGEAVGEHESKNPSQKSEKNIGDIEGEKEAESGLVFLPSFGRRNRRSVHENEENTKQETLAQHGPPSTNAQNNKETKQDTQSEKEAESGLVFLPSFGRRNKRSIPEDKEETKQAPLSEHRPPSTNAQKNGETTHDDESSKAAESGLVFLPSFGRRSRRSVDKQEDLLHSESNIVFLPSFRRNGIRRFRRDVTKRSVETQTESDNKKGAGVTEQNEELSDSDAVNGEESGLVFLPSFGRRSRRSADDQASSISVEQDVPKEIYKNEQKDEELKIKREVATQIADKTKGEDDFDQNKDDETEEESGLVFIPSFGRRQRRDTASTASPVKKEDITTTTKKDDQVTKKTISAQESGLVFLPSFNRRSRRGVSTEKPKEVDHNSNSPDVEEQESGLVFLPSFGRRARRFVLY